MKPTRFAENRSACHPGGYLCFGFCLRSIRMIAAIGCWKIARVCRGGSGCVPAYRRFQFSNLSYALIAIFLALHAVGAHYTYAKVPAGFWMADWLHLSRNHYDRVIHFGFGFLLLYPMRELMMRRAGANGKWASWLAVAALAALSSCFEVVEVSRAIVSRSSERRISAPKANRGRAKGYGAALGTRCWCSGMTVSDKRRSLFRRGPDPHELQ